MERQTATDFFDTISQDYTRQNFHQIAARYELPGALYIEDDIVVWQDHHALVGFLKEHCRCNFALGARSVRAKVIAQSINTTNNFSIWVEWQHLDHAGAQVFATQFRYFCRRAEDGSPVIQLVEVPERPAHYLQEGVPSPFGRLHHRPRVHPLKRQKTSKMRAELWSREA